jgi:hypothetical protein
MILYGLRVLFVLFLLPQISNTTNSCKKKKKNHVALLGGGGAVFVFCFYCFAPREASVSVACPRINQLRNSNKGKWPQNSRRVEGKQQQQQ